MNEELIKNIRAQIHVTEKYRQLKALMLALSAAGQPPIPIRPPPTEPNEQPVPVRDDPPKDAA